MDQERTMRRRDKAWSADEALELLKHAYVIHLAGALEDGTPILRPLHGAWLGSRLFFHGATLGEKTGLLGRPVQVGAHRVIAEIPSYTSDPERACPATTFFMSASGRGVLREVEDPVVRAAALQALMERFQPEGGHRPITAGDPLYERAIAAISVVEVTGLTVEGKASFGQNRPASSRAAVLEVLWRRGRPEDPAAIDLVADLAPPDPWPSFLVGPGGRRLRCALDARHVSAAVALLRNTYWNEGVPDDRIAAAQLGSPVWVGMEEDGALVATARATTDGVRRAYLADVCVAPHLQGQGLGHALIRFLLDHPRIRGCRDVELHTRTAARFYEDLGFTRWTDPPERVELHLTR